MFEGEIYWLRAIYALGLPWTSYRLVPMTDKVLLRQSTEESRVLTTSRPREFLSKLFQLSLAVLWLPPCYERIAQLAGDRVSAGLHKTRYIHASLRRH